MPTTYEQIMYEKLITHATCLNEDEVGLDMWTSAIEIVNYDDGANLAVECTKCNEVIMDVNRPPAPEVN